MVMLGALHRFPDMTVEELQMALNDALNALLNSDQFSDGEKSLARTQFGTAGGHERALWAALFLADGDNLARYAMGFPGEVAALRAWKDGDLKQRFNQWGVDL